MTRDRTRTTWPLVVAIAALVCSLTLVPFNPKMPEYGLDASATFATDFSVANGLVLGRDSIFVYGPYSSLYRMSYFPGTYAMTIVAGLFLAGCYAAVLVSLWGKHRPIGVLCSSAALAICVVYSRNVVLFVYPLLVAIYSARLLGPGGLPSADRGSLTTFSILLAPFGLLPLIKASLLPLAAAVALLIAVLAASRRAYRAALLCGISPAIGCLLFWVLRGQPTDALLDFLVSTARVPQGYSDAMSLDGGTSEIVIYLVSAIATLSAILCCRTIPARERLFLASACGLVLLIGLKAAFVRHDGHAWTAAGVALLGAISLSVVGVAKKPRVAALAAAVVAWCYIGEFHGGAAISPLADLRVTVGGGLAGLVRSLRSPGWLDQEFERATAEIRADHPLPELAGTADIYSHNQVALLATRNRWNPRPAFQSATVYTPSLAAMNERHLRGDRAPDHVIFRLEPIDGRLPALEDGLSWPALFDNYRLDRIDRDYVYLKKNEGRRTASAFGSTSVLAARLGEAVALPRQDQPLFAVVAVEPTRLGMLADLVFKRPQLSITMEFHNGTAREFRAPSGMMRAGFFISPFIGTQADFAMLATGHHDQLSGKQVRSIRIGPAHPRFWRTDYSITLQSYQGGQPQELPVGFFHPLAASPPAETVRVVTGDCRGAIDVVNGARLSTAAPLRIVGTLAVDGWLAVDPWKGKVPEEVFVTLTDDRGRVWYAKPNRMERPDVQRQFGRLAMMNAGYRGFFDVTGLRGAFTMGMAYADEQQVTLCRQFATPVVLGR